MSTDKNRLPAFPDGGQTGGGHAFDASSVPGAPPWFADAIAQLRFSKQLVRWFNLVRVNISGSGGAAFSSGTYAARPAATDGALYYATDQTTWYAGVGSAWIYQSGEMRGTLSPDQKPALSATEVGFTFVSTDFNRRFRWTGAAWTRSPGEDPHMFIGMPADPGIGWAYCDGSGSIVETNVNGTLSALAFSGLAAGHVPDWNDGEFMRMASACTGAAIVEANTLAVGNDNAFIGAAFGGLDTSLHTHQHPLSGTIIPAHGAVLPYYRL